MGGVEMGEEGAGGGGWEEKEVEKEGYVED